MAKKDKQQDEGQSEMTLEEELQSMTPGELSSLNRSLRTMEVLGNRTVREAQRVRKALTDAYNLKRKRK